MGYAADNNNVTEGKFALKVEDMYIELNIYSRDWIISSHTMVFLFIYDSVIFFIIIVSLIACKMLVAAIFGGR